MLLTLAHYFGVNMSGILGTSSEWMRNIEEEGWIKNFECVAGDRELFPGQAVCYLYSTDRCQI